MSEDQFGHFDVEVPEEDDGSRFPTESVPSTGWLDGWFDVDGNEVVCRTHFLIFLAVALLVGAGVGTLIAIVTS